VKLPLGPLLLTADRDRRRIPWNMPNSVSPGGQGPEPLLYHYTHAAALLGILSQNKLRATNYLTHNDSSELVYGLELAVAETRVILSSRRSARLAALLSALEQLRLEEVGAYYASLSENGNLLSHWRNYSGTQGFALGFRAMRDGQLQFRATDGNPLLLCPVIYEEEEQRRKMRQFLEEVSEGSVTPASTTQEDDLPRLITLTSTFKHRGFREEREWRIMYHVHYLEDRHCDEIQVLAEGNDLLSFVELLPLGGVLPIECITCGPGVYVTAARQALRILLQRSGYQHVKIEVSDIPAV
jgi:Protein of unknown function (DUF2971)